MSALDPGETMLLRMIDGLSAEDMRNIITHGVDLSKIAEEEFGDYLPSAKLALSSYDATHPGLIQGGVSDFNASAHKVLEWLKKKRPDLGYEIEAYVAYPTTLSLGLVVVAASPQTETYAAATVEHVGLAWLASQLEGFARLLL